MKKILLLGGSRYLLPVIKSAHELGLYVITCDYLPNNIAHKYSDEYVNVSIIDKEAVLEVAEKLCDKVAIIKSGKLIRSGTMEDVKGDDSLEEVFLELEGE